MLMLKIQITSSFRNLGCATFGIMNVSNTSVALYLYHVKSAITLLKVSMNISKLLYSFIHSCYHTR